MNFDKVMRLIGRLAGTLKFFPSDPDARFGIAQEIADMAANEEQVTWLVGRLPKLFTEWPGLLEVRAVFCTRYKPQDGVEAALGSSSPAFVALCGDEVPALPSGRRMIAAPVTSDPELLAMVARCAKLRPQLPQALPATQQQIDAIKEQQAKNRRENAAD